MSILRIVTTPEYVKADFGYYATNYYIRGGWVRIDKDTFLRDVKTGQKKRLIKALNIPVETNQLREYRSIWRPDLLSIFRNKIHFVSINSPLSILRI